MASEMEMSTPVTRGELREELTQLEQRFDQKLETWGGALLAQIQASEQRLLVELARHVKAVQESLLIPVKAIDEKYSDLPMQIRAVDEKYSDLPPRVHRLEAKVFVPRRKSPR